MEQLEYSFHLSNSFIFTTFPFLLSSIYFLILAGEYYSIRRCATMEGIPSGRYGCLPVVVFYTLPAFV